MKIDLELEEAKAANNALYHQLTFGDLHPEERRYMESAKAALADAISRHYAGIRTDNPPDSQAPGEA